MSDVSHDLIDRARMLAPVLVRHAAEAERMRQPHDEAIRQLRDAGLFELMVPRRHGGLELDLDSFLEVGLALGEGDASMAWVTCFYIEHNWMLCQFPESFQKTLFASRSHWLAPASIAPGGVARATADGFRLSGRWKWGTGIVHAEWVMVGAVVRGSSSSTPDIRLFALPRSAVSVDDTWHVDGMAATGSHDIVIEDALVPDEQSVGLMAMTTGTAPGSRIHTGPLYRTPMIPILALTAAMPALGQARASIRAFRERLAERVLYGTAGVRQSDKPAAQMRLARADIEARQVELSMRALVAEVMDRRDQATLADRARWTATLAHGVDQCKRILQSISEASGASAHFLDHPLQRALRDVNVIACHVVFDLDQRLEMYGRALLGRDPEGIV
jgi:3-hydroxy-9,10-secoandrosta-1,3,5(10)-triene-9,17-dione monooxygenase